MGKMKLSEIAGIVGVPVVNLTIKSIQEAERKGAITRQLSAELQAEMIWQPYKAGTQVAKRLW